jgi:hypothetical protein
MESHFMSATGFKGLIPTRLSVSLPMRRETPYALEYDSAGWSSEGLGKNLQLSDGNHITIERCSKPVNLRKARSGRITCFLRDL